MYLKLEDQNVNKLFEILMDQLEDATRMREYYREKSEAEHTANAEAQQRIEALEAEIKLLHEDREKLRSDNKDLIDTFMYRGHRSELTKPLQQ